MAAIVEERDIAGANGFVKLCYKFTVIPIDVQPDRDYEIQFAKGVGNCRSVGRRVCQWGGMSISRVADDKRAPSSCRLWLGTHCPPEV